MNKLNVINLYGGPGSGKSTTAAALFAKMKILGYKVELVTEYAKDMIYEQRDNVLEDQLYILAKQSRRLSRLIGKVDWVVTDSPLLLTLIYNKQNILINNLAKELFSQYQNYNYFVNRVKEYQPYGRNQTESEAIAIDERVISMLIENDQSFCMINGDENAPNVILGNFRTN